MVVAVIAATVSAIVLFMQTVAAVVAAVVLNMHRLQPLLVLLRR